MARRTRATGSDMTFDNTAVFITPFLDMAFQILTFFVFTYNPTAMEGQFTIALAAGEAGGEQSKPVADPKVAPVETRVKPSVSVIARSRPDGKLESLEIVHGSASRIVIKPPATEADVDPGYFLAELHKRLVELKKQYATEDRIVLRCSLRMPWGLCMKIMDACRRYDVEGKREELFPNVELDLLHN